MANRLLDRLRKQTSPPPRYTNSFLRGIVSGGLYRMDSMHSDSSLASIHTQIEVMRALAKDSQISTALSYYATDATTPNTDGQILWATSDIKGLADIINMLFKRWDINTVARDHILELATIGNLYMPTTDMYKEEVGRTTTAKVVLDNNTIADIEYDMVPLYKIPPEEVIHVYYHGQPQGYIYRPEDNSNQTVLCPESAIVHFSLGGLLGEYTIDTTQPDGTTKEYDIKFASPLMARAVQPTQTLSLLEDSTILSSLIRVVRFINVEVNDTDSAEEARATLQEIKDVIEQQLSINTNNGDTQSFVNPQSPNNLVYLPKVNGADPISITTLDMAESDEKDNKLLQYYQDKKLSVLGVPKEAMNFSSNEGLGGAGSVLSQRSALYANSLLRLETAYIEGWRSALNMYFQVRNMSGYVDRFKLHMNPIITTQSTITFDRRDSALNQATSLVALLKDMGVTDKKDYLQALTEILAEAFPQMGASANSWKVNVADEGGGGQ